MLVDPETWDLVQHVDSVLAKVTDGEFQARVMPELMQSTIEITTPVCSSAAEVDVQLRRLRAYVAKLAADDGCRVRLRPTARIRSRSSSGSGSRRRIATASSWISSSTSPGASWSSACTCTPRSTTPDKAIQVVNGLLIHLPEFLALSASSPLWRGEPTGLSSSRQMIFSAFPRSGVPPRFDTYEEFAALVGQLERTGCIADYTHIWWDIRLHPRLGTVELRICDAVTRVEDAVALAAYFQALVKMLCEHVEDGGTVPTFHRILTTENKWLARAARPAGPGDGSRHRAAKQGADRTADPPDGPRPRAARSASSGRNASWRASRRSSRAGTAPRSSSASGTRTATSRRSCRTSRPPQKSASPGAA